MRSLDEIILELERLSKLYSYEVSIASPGLDRSFNIAAYAAKIEILRWVIDASPR